MYSRHLSKLLQAQAIPRRKSRSLTQCRLSTNQSLKLKSFRGPRRRRQSRAKLPQFKSSPPRLRRPPPPRYLPLHRFLLREPRPGMRLWEPSWLVLLLSSRLSKEVPTSSGDVWTRLDRPRDNVFPSLPQHSQTPHSFGNTSFTNISYGERLMV